MVTAAENERTVVAVLADRFDVPVHRIEPGRVTVVSTPKASAAVRAFLHAGPSEAPLAGGPAGALAPGRAADMRGPAGAPGVLGNGAGGVRVGDVVVMARPEHVELARRLLTDPATIEADLAELAGGLGGRLIGVVARTGLHVPEPETEVTLTSATDRRLPDWVIGHFTGPAWVVLSPDGRVLSTAVLKDYDERLREISVGTEETARGRGLAKAVVRAAARDVLAHGRSVLYLHDLGNHASAAVAAASGLGELGRVISVVGERRAT